MEQNPKTPQRDFLSTLSFIHISIPLAMEAVAIATVNQAHLCMKTRPLSGNFTAGSVSALGFSLPSSGKFSAFTHSVRGRSLVTRASVAVEEKTETKTAVIRIGTRGR